MKTIKYLSSLVVCSLFMLNAAKAQNQSGVDSTGLPGDNFSLQGALQLFQDAASPEAFEEAINKEGNHVNNLDLDEDGNTDYVQVVGKMDKDAHVFILQVAVSEKETQDIAVIELEKTGNATAVIQIIGDEDIYGEQVIVEPADSEAAAISDYSNNSNLSGPNVDFENSYSESGLIINVWLWPSVRFVYAPAYRPWVSPWRWNYHPSWWKPWKPLRWHVWHPFRVHHHRPFVVVHTHRGIHARSVYSPYRSSSAVVRTRHAASVNNYRVIRTRTTVTGPRGNTTTVKKTTVTGPRGNRATKVRVRRR
jgi:hypothetical protein